MNSTQLGSLYWNAPTTKRPTISNTRSSSSHVINISKYRSTGKRRHSYHDENNNNNNNNNDDGNERRRISESAEMLVSVFSGDKEKDKDIKLVPVTKDYGRITLVCLK